MLFREFYTQKTGAAVYPLLVKTFRVPPGPHRSAGDVLVDQLSQSLLFVSLRLLTLSVPGVDGIVCRSGHRYEVVKRIELTLVILGRYNVMDCIGRYDPSFGKLNNISISVVAHGCISQLLPTRGVILLLYAFRLLIAISFSLDAFAFNPDG